MIMMRGVIIFAVTFSAIISPGRCARTKTLQQLKSSYGESCSVNQPCNSRESMTCRDEICQCIQPSAMLYNHTRNLCQVLTGELCQGLEQNEEGDYDQVGTSQSRLILVNPTTQKLRSRTYYDECADHASCRLVLPKGSRDKFKEERRCVCDDEYFQDADRVCRKLGEFNNTCESDSGCNAELSLICINGTCQCDPSLSIVDFSYVWRKKTPRCVGIAGRPCPKGQDCVKNAMCVMGNKCACLEPFVQKQDRSPQCDAIGYGGECSHRSDGLNCHSNFTCLGNSCKCKYDAEHQFYDSKLKSCRSFVFAPCDLNATSDQQCTDRAECVWNKETELAECACSYPYVENGKGLCEDLQFGAECNTARSSPALSAKCDRLAGLFCRDDKCNCGNDLQVFDKDERRCRSVVGSICYNSSTCVSGSFCKKRYNSNNPTGPGQCVPFTSTLWNLQRRSLQDTTLLEFLSSLSLTQSGYAFANRYSPIL